MSTASPEDRLAALLREQAGTIVPSNGGLSRIQARLARRRRARWAVVPGAALVTAAVVLAVVLADGTDDRSSLRQVLVTPSASPLLGQPFTPAIWPFASHAQADAWRHAQSGRPWAASNLGVAQHFVDDYLRLSGIHLVQTCVSCDVVELVNADGRDVGTVGLVREDDGSPRAYSVAGVSVRQGFSVTAPREGGRISSPLTVRGTIVGVDDNVAISLVAQDGRTIASSAAPAGSGAPWATTLTWTDDRWYTGALVLKTYSPKDGTLNRLVVLRVTRGT